MKGAMRDLFLKKIVDISEYRVNFKALVFLKFFFYHLISFYLYPLIFVVVPLIDSMNLVHNMLMVPKCNRGVFF